MSPDEIATMLDALADAITERAAKGRPTTSVALTGDQALTVVVMALRQMAERVSQQ